MSLVRSAEDENELDRLEVGSAPGEAGVISVEAVVPLYPTEDSAAVGMAISNMFPTMDLEVAGCQMTGRAEGPSALARFRRRLREMCIRDTARTQLGRGMVDGTLVFCLNKQSAYARVPNFSTGNPPLGDIDVSVTAEDLGPLVDWLCELDDD